MSVSVNQSNVEDSANTEVAFRIAQALGVKVDSAQRIVDTYGVDYCLPALEYIQGQLRSGKRLTNPFGALVGVLKTGKIQTQTVQNRERKATGTEWLLLRCPRCRAFQSLTFPVYADGPEPWDQKPMLKCGECKELVPTIGWHVSISHFQPFELSEGGKRIEARRQYPTGAELAESAAALEATLGEQFAGLK